MKSYDYHGSCCGSSFNKKNKNKRGAGMMGIMGEMIKWLRNPMRQFAIHFLKAPPGHPDWQDPEVQKMIKKINYYIWFFLSLIVLMILLMLFGSSHAFC